MKIVIPTQKTEEQYFKSVPGQCLLKIQKGSKELGQDFNIAVFAENTIGLSELYETIVSITPDDEEYVLFIHDDVEIHDAFLVQKLKKAHEFYDIVGLAGAITQDYTTNKPSVWHLSRSDDKDIRGFVSHFIPKGFNNNSVNHYNSVYFGPTPHEVVVIDGLFMSFKLSSLREKLVFDKDFKWHHYDMAMCVNAKRNQLKIGVWPIFVIHYGLGEFQDSVWEESNKLFKKKYGTTRGKI